MKVVLISVLISLFLICCFLLSSCNNSTEPEESQTQINFTLYNGYSYKGDKSSKDTTLYYCTTTKEGFDSLFYFIADHNPSPQIPENDFLVKSIISIVKCGNNYCDLEVEEVTILNETLYVRYNSILLAENISWTAAIPLLITIDKPFNEIIFYENGEEIAEIDIYK